MCIAPGHPEFLAPWPVHAKVAMTNVAKVICKLHRGLNRVMKDVATTEISNNPTRHKQARPKRVSENTNQTAGKLIASFGSPLNSAVEAITQRTVPTAAVSAEIVRTRCGHCRRLSTGNGTALRPYM
jgi:hypothetical protein